MPVVSFARPPRIIRTFPRLTQLSNQAVTQVLTVFGPTVSASLVNAYMPNAVLTGANLYGHDPLANQHERRHSLSEWRDPEREPVSQRQELGQRLVARLDAAAAARLRAD